MNARDLLFTRRCMCWGLLAASLLFTGCTSGELNANDPQGDDSSAQRDMMRDVVPSSDQDGVGVADMDPIITGDQGTPADMPDPYLDLMKCDDANFWPVATPLRQLTPVQLYLTLDQAFYPDGDARLPASVRAGTGDRSLEEWVHSPRADADSGLIRIFPEVEWSEDSFTNQPQRPTALTIDSYERFASWFLSFTNQNPMSSTYMYGNDEVTGWSPCRPDERSATHDDLISCGAEIVDVMIPKLIRRPIADAEERQAYLDFMTQSIDQFHDPDSRGPGGTPFTKAVQLFFRGVLQTPQVIYRTEYGTSEMLAEGQATPLSDFELANRLSFFFWNAPPDQELWDLAQAGTLHEDAVLEAQARRLLKSPRARQTMNSFFAGWLKLEKLENISMSFRDENIQRVIPTLPSASVPADCPEAKSYTLRDTDLDNMVPRSMRQSVLNYVDWAFWEEDNFEEFLSGNRVFSNHLLSGIYQWPEVPMAQVDERADSRGDRCTTNAAKAIAIARVTERYELVTVPDEERRGILTQPGVMAMSSHDGKHAPILRGVHLLNSLLCQEMGFPSGLEFDTIETQEDVCTTRDYISLTHTNSPACQSCHGLIDGLGFAFDHYDQIGAYVTEEGHTRNRKCEVDASTSIPEQTLPNAPIDVAGQFNDASELAPTLATSDTVKACMVAHWMRFVHGRRELSPSAADYSERFKAQRTCQQNQIVSLAKQLDDKGGSMQELVISLVTSPSFRLKALDPTQQGGAP